MTSAESCKNDRPKARPVVVGEAGVDALAKLISHQSIPCMGFLRDKWNPDVMTTLAGQQIDYSLKQLRDNYCSTIVNYARNLCLTYMLTWMV